MNHPTASLADAAATVDTDDTACRPPDDAGLAATAVVHRDAAGPPAEGVSPLGDGPPEYALGEVVGVGGMGVVYRARDVALERDVAVKLLAVSYAAGSINAVRFIKEAQITGQLQHPGIPAVHKVGVTPAGRPYLAMKLIRGETLENMLKSGTRVNALSVFESICQAVGYAHAHRVIHRDLKPANVMVGAFGEVQVMDWGLAKVLTADADAPRDPEAIAAGIEIRTLDADLDMATRAGSVMGTLAYMPPEQASGATSEVDERSDVFGLGALLCALLTGEPPFAGATAGSVHRAAKQCDTHAAFARLDACGADPGVVALCKCCLAHRPLDRPSNAGAVAAEVAGLRRAADERARRAELDAHEAGVRALEQAKRRRLTQRAAAAFALVLSLGVAGLTVGLVRDAQARQAEAEHELAVQDSRREASAERAARAEDRYRALFQLATARGDAWAILKAYPESRREGIPPAPGVLPDYLNAVAAVHGTERVLKELDAVPPRDIPPEDRGRLSLWRATCLFGVDDAAAGRALADALAGPLPPAERAFALGLRAETIPAGTAEYRRAIDLDPLYQPARSAACFGLLAEGRGEEAATLADESARLFPRRPDFPVVQFLAGTFRGDKAQVAAAGPRVRALVPADQAEMILALTALLAQARRSTSDMTTSAVGIASAARKSTGLLAGAFGTLPPAQRGQLLGYLAPIARANLLLRLWFPDLKLTPEALAANADSLPEAFLLWGAADAYFDRAGLPGRPWPEAVADFRAAAAYGERASKAPANIPEYRAFGLDAATFALGLVGYCKFPNAVSDPAASQQAATLARRRRDEFGPVIGGYTLGMIKIARRAGDLTLARRFAEDWLKKSPDDPAAHYWSAEVELAIEAYGPAAARAEKALALIKGNDAAAAELRTEATRVRDEARGKLK